jgi:hypothetical protein
MQTVDADPTRLTRAAHVDRSSGQLLHEAAHRFSNFVGDRHSHEEPARARRIVLRPHEGAPPSAARSPSIAHRVGRSHSL